jgi:hypothetical protein
VKFAYYQRLGARQRRIYDRSDAAGIVSVPGAAACGPLVAAVGRALAADARPETERATQRLVDEILRRLHVQPVRVRVLAVRPSSSREELHGLYEFGGNRPRPVITVWMRTAQKRRVVAFRTFLRTLLHEVVHHLDYQHFHLEDSFHTQGFYKRAESLYRQLVPEEMAREMEPRAAVEAATVPAVTSRGMGETRVEKPPRQSRRPAPVQPRLPFL